MKVLNMALHLSQEIHSGHPRRQAQSVQNRLRGSSGISIGSQAVPQEPLDFLKASDCSTR